MIGYHFRLKTFASFLVTTTIVVSFVLWHFCSFGPGWKQIGSTTSTNKELQTTLSENISSILQDPNILFFNRVPKCGSEMLVLLLQWLQQKNKFSHKRLKNSAKRFLSVEEQNLLGKEINRLKMKNDLINLSLDRHVYFTRFSNLDGPSQPTWVNLVRNPVDKLVSRFYYARVTPRPGGFTAPNHKPPPIPKFLTLEECLEMGGAECTFLTGRHYDLTIPYFCGHEDYCRELNNERALERAKQNVLIWYPVVGVLEEINATLDALELRIPRFFKGIKSVYYEELGAPHYNHNMHHPTASPFAESVVRQNLSLEMSFYEFLKDRLLNQASQLPYQN